MKLFAVIVLVGAGYFAGGLAAEKRTRAFLQAEGILRLLYTVRDGIQSSRAGLFDVFCAFSDPALEECGFLRVLRGGAPPVRISWETACRGLSPDIPMYKAISDLGNELGMSDAATQVEMLSRICGELELCTGELRRELRARTGNYRLLGALAGCMAAIVLY